PKRLIHAGKVEVRAVEEPRPEVVVRIVIQPDEPLGALGIAKDPRPEPLFDELLLLAGGEGRLLVDDAYLLIPVTDRVVDHRGLHVEGELQEPRAVGASRAVLGDRGNRLRRSVVGIEAPDSIALQMSDRGRRR